MKHFNGDRLANFFQRVFFNVICELWKKCCHVLNFVMICYSSLSLALAHPWLFHFRLIAFLLQLSSLFWQNKVELESNLGRAQGEGSDDILSSKEWGSEAEWLLSELVLSEIDIFGPPETRRCRRTLALKSGWRRACLLKTKSYQH